MHGLGDLLLYYLPITIIGCLVYASLKRPTLAGIVPIALRYFVGFTAIVVGCIVVLEVVPLVFPG